MSISLNMDEKQLNYIEENGILFERLGMTRMAGRVFGYLIVSDKKEASFDDIRLALKASKGSISGTTKQLVNAGLIQPVSLSGDRKTYFRLNKIEVGKILEARLQLFVKFSEMISKGGSLKKNEDELTDWLKELSTFYDWIGGEIKEIIVKWEKEKDKIIENYEDKHKKQKK